MQILITHNKLPKHITAGTIDELQWKAFVNDLIEVSNKHGIKFFISNNIEDVEQLMKRINSM